MEFKGLATLLFVQRQVLLFAHTHEHEEQTLPKFKDFVFYDEELERGACERMVLDVLSSAINDGSISVENWMEVSEPNELLQEKLNIKRGENFEVLRKVYKARLRMVRSGAYRKTNDDYRYDVQVASLFANVGKPYLEGKNISPVSIYVSG